MAMEGMTVRCCIPYVLSYFRDCLKVAGCNLIEWSTPWVNGVHPHLTPPSPTKALFVYRCDELDLKTERILWLCFCDPSRPDKFLSQLSMPWVMLALHDRSG